MEKSHNRTFLSPFLIAWGLGFVVEVKGGYPKPREEGQ